MKHKSKNGKTYEIGSIMGYEGKETYDIVVIMDWNIDGLPMKIVDYYFGDYDYETTEDYINSPNSN